MIPRPEDIARVRIEKMIESIFETFVYRGFVSLSISSAYDFNRLKKDYRFGASDIRDEMFRAMPKSEREQLADLLTEAGWTVKFSEVPRDPNGDEDGYVVLSVSRPP